MRKFVLVLVAVFMVTTLIGCSKKKKSEDAALDNMSNGVVSENVVSMTDLTAEGKMDASAIPVIVDNAEALPQTSGDMAAGVVAQAVGDKPTPKQIQQALKNAGVYKGKVDGTIGPKTKKAIEEFQAQNGLKADGKVGPRTWKALSAHLNETTEVANPTAQTENVGQ